MHDLSISPAGACIGPCNRRAREAWKTFHAAREAHADALDAWAALPQDERGEPPAEPAQPEARWWPGDPLVCERDKAACRAALAELDDLAALRLHYGDGWETRGGQGERVSGSAEPPSPSSGFDDVNETIHWLRGIEDAYRAAQGWPAAPYRGEAAPALTGGVAWLSAHLDGVLAHPGLALETLDGILSRHRRAGTATHTRKRRVSKPLRCPQCHLATLSQEEGSDRVECRNRDCGESRGGPVVLSEAEYSALVEQAATAAKTAKKVPA